MSMRVAPPQLARADAGKRCVWQCARPAALRHPCRLPADTCEGRTAVCMSSCGAVQVAPAPNFYEHSTTNAAALPHHTVEVFLFVHYKCRYGQRLVIVGDLADVGAWDPRRGLELSWSDGDTWRGSVRLPAGAVLEYKYVVVDKLGAAVRWQEGRNLRLQISDTSALRQPVTRLDVHDDWSQTRQEVLPHVVDASAGFLLSGRLMQDMVRDAIQLAAQQLRTAQADNVQDDLAGEQLLLPSVTEQTEERVAAAHETWACPGDEALRSAAVAPLVAVVDASPAQHASSSMAIAPGAAPEVDTVGQGSGEAVVEQHKPRHTGSTCEPCEFEYNTVDVDASRVLGGKQPAPSISVSARSWTAGSADIRVLPKPPVRPRVGMTVRQAAAAAAAAAAATVAAAADGTGLPTHGFCGLSHHLAVCGDAHSDLQGAYDSLVAAMATSQRLCSVISDPADPVLLAADRQMAAEADALRLLMAL